MISSGKFPPGAISVKNRRGHNMTTSGAVLPTSEPNPTCVQKRDGIYWSSRLSSCDFVRTRYQFILIVISRPRHEHDMSFCHFVILRRNALRLLKALEDKDLVNQWTVQFERKKINSVELHPHPSRAEDIRAGQRCYLYHPKVARQLDYFPDLNSSKMDSYARNRITLYLATPPDRSLSAVEWKPIVPRVEVTVTSTYI
ncbi:uncharacterized protein ARMOST_20804 [Armillaria ostoyae]|uniref:Uncharacterized protein n=1 Tax=Armillaria ostoyae TaxID=47428 RepID=A0A284S8E2_ARMOS|nr:uncharacterized protein ARMOST_20804 [Armillaria ostoyae]